MNVPNPAKTILSCCLMLAFFTLNQSLIAQSKVGSGKPTPNNCEDALLYLDNSATEASKESESYVIAISRLGDGERSLSLHRRRLGFVRGYLSNQRGWDKFVTATGDRVQGLGRVELYVGGKLLYVLHYKRRGYISCAGLG